VTEGKERLGDPTELALVDYAELHKMDEQDARKNEHASTKNRLIVKEN
jgi:hypothetical protein